MAKYSSCHVVLYGLGNMNVCRLHTDEGNTTADTSTTFMYQMNSFDQVFFFV